jgi:hypothetical protein
VGKISPLRPFQLDLSLHRAAFLNGQLKGSFFLTTMEKFGKLQLSEDANPSSCGRRMRSCKNHSIDSTLGFNFDPDMTEFESEFWSILVSLLSPDKNYQDILDAVENAVKLINNLYPTGLPATPRGG